MAWVYDWAPYQKMDARPIAERWARKGRPKQRKILARAYLQELWTHASAPYLVICGECRNQYIPEDPKKPSRCPFCDRDKFYKLAFPGADHD